MRFTVVWSPVAQDQLAEIWVRATDRAAITQASHRIDQLLRVDPHLLGFPWYGDRLITVLPLRVIVSINWMDMIAQVEEVLDPP